MESNFKYPKGEDGEPDTSRDPTLKVKLPTWEGDFKFELYDVDNVMLLPNSSGNTPETLIPKGCNMVCLIQCGGLWFANGNFGITWRLTQGVVKPTETLVKGKCHIALSNDDREQITKNTPSNNDNSSNDPTHVESDEEENEDEEINNQTEENDDEESGLKEPEFKPEPELREKL